jgi:hypothetical protein
VVECRDCIACRATAHNLIQRDSVDGYVKWALSFTRIKQLSLLGGAK